MALAGIVAVFGTYASLKASKADRRAAKLAARKQELLTERQVYLDERHAESIKEQSLQTAENIRADAIMIRSKQVASFASSGVMVGNGSAQAMVDETLKLSEQDVWITIYNGEKGYLTAMENGRLTEMAGNVQAAAYNTQADAARQHGYASLLSNTSSIISTFENSSVSKTSAGDEV